jgi:hypothetical protein
MKKLLLSTVLFSIILLGCKTKKILTNNVNNKQIITLNDKNVSKNELLTYFDNYIQNDFSKKYKGYQEIKTDIVDTINFYDLASLDTSNLTRMQYLERIIPSKKQHAININITYRVFGDIFGDIFDKTLLSYYDTTSKNFTKINLLDSSLKYNKKYIDNGKNTYCYNVIQIFKFDTESGNETDTITTYFLEDEIFMFSVAFKYKKGINYLGTIKQNKNAMYKEEERYIKDFKRAKKIR